MQFPKIAALASMVLAVSAAPAANYGTPSSTTSKVAATSANTATATSTASPFINQCANVGLTVLDCTQLLNIAALNDNSVNVGGNLTAPAGAVNNGQQFVNKCDNLGVSVADCAQVLNLAILDGNSIDIDLGSLTDLLDSLNLGGLVGGLLSAVGSLVGGLIAIPAGLL